MHQKNTTLYNQKKKKKKKTKQEKKIGKKLEKE